MADRGAAAVSREGTPDPLLGRVINDKFKVLSFIARGGMGKVYRAEQMPLGRVCALKVLNANYTGEHDPEFHKRFFLEASMTSKLRHPSTVTIFDYGQTTDGIYYMAMEYLEGYTLHRAIRQFGHLPEERSAHIARQICRSLREAHLLGVVHRDLKPANVYLLEHGDEPDFVKVLDFGLVKEVARTDGEELTKAGLFMGSPKYMAPEQISGAPIDARTDIYALGVIMYEMVTGKVPFDHPKSLDILMAKMKEEIPPIHTMNPAARVSPAMEEAILRSMAKDPNDRFRSMDEVLAALKRLGPTTGVEPSASLTADRLSLSGGTDASRIVRGVGAAMAVPEGASDEYEEASAAAGPEAAGERAARGAGVYLLAGAIVFVLALAIGIGYAKMRAAPGPVRAVATAPAVLPPAVTVTVTMPESAARAAPVAAASVAPIATAPAAPVGAPSAAGEATTARGPVKPIAEGDVSSAPMSSPGVAVAPGAPGAKVTPAALPAKPKAAVAKGPGGGAAPAAPKPASDCNPSYYYDSDGNKHFKPECFSH